MIQFGVIGAASTRRRGSLLNPQPISAEIYDLIRPLYAGTNISKSGFYFFKHYETANYQNVVCDKKYFFLYSPDHDIGASGLFWGKGDNLDLSDFVEVGLIHDGDQSETPWYIELDGVSHLYFHTMATENGNNNKQQTRLFTYSGAAAELHLMPFVDSGRPLGIFGDDNHTGYAKVYDISPNRVIATHIRKQGLPQPWARSVSTDRGLTFTREEDIDTVTGIETGYFFKPSIGTYFNFNGFQWFIGIIESDAGGGQKMIVGKSNGVDYSSITQKAVIWALDVLRVHSVKIVGTTAYVQFTRDKNSLFQGKYDLNNLYNF